jgi:hypothetical protein
MIKKIFFILLAGLAAFCLLVNCAGGTGAGNPTAEADPPPTGQAAFTIRAISTYGQPLQKRLQNPLLPKASNTDSIILIADRGSTLFYIQSAHLNVRQIKVGLPENMTCSDIGYELEAPALCGQGKIVLDGPFVFDLVTGLAVPPVDTLKMPVGLYNTIELVLDAGIPIDVPIDTVPVRQQYTLELNGIFSYDTIANRQFSLLLSFEETFPLFLTQTIEVSDKTLAEFHVQFNLNTLLEGIDITSCLNNKGLILDSAGNLLIERNRMRGLCMHIENTLKQNFKNMEIRMNGNAVVRSNQ